jgi:hypothetical protein
MGGQLAAEAASRSCKATHVWLVVDLGDLESRVGTKGTRLDAGGKRLAPRQRHSGAQDGLHGV